MINYTKLVIAIFSFFLICMPHAYSQSGEREDTCETLEGDVTVESLVSCVVYTSQMLSSLRTENGRLLERLEILEQNTQDSQPIIDFPTGAVVAFDLNGGCPYGWAVYRPGAGRTIVGAGFGNRSEDEQNLSTRTHGAVGGQENVQLSIENLPAHNHSVDIEEDFRGLRFVLERSGHSNVLATGGPDAGIGYDLGGRVPTQGDFVPHNNMPPFIVLQYCRKN